MYFRIGSSSNPIFFCRYRYHKSSPPSHVSSLSDEYLIADRLFNYSVDCCASYLLLHDFFRDRKAIEDLDDLLIVRQMFWRVYSIIGSVEKNAGYIRKDDFRKKLVPDQDRISGMDLIELHVIFEAVVNRSRHPIVCRDREKGSLPG